MGDLHATLSEALIIDPSIVSEKTNWERDEAPKPISTSRVQSLLDSWLRGTRVVDVALLKGGLMNRNFRVRLDRTPHVCVLRLYDANPARRRNELP